MARNGRKLKFTNLSNPWQRFRSQTGLSQVELAEALKIKQPAVSAYELGNLPSTRIAKRFVDLAKKHRVRMSLDEVYGALTV